MTALPTTGMRGLDVAAGTGNASLPAARRGAEVTASDLTPELLAAGRRRAEGEGLSLEWLPADAEHLPFEDASLDVVMSCIGAMFAPHHRQAEFDEALDQFCDEWDRGREDGARFEMEYLLAVGRRAGAA